MIPKMIASLIDSENLTEAKVYGQNQQKMSLV